MIHQVAQAKNLGIILDFSLSTLFSILPNIWLDNKSYQLYPKSKHVSLYSVEKLFINPIILTQLNSVLAKLWSHLSPRVLFQSCWQIQFPVVTGWKPLFSCRLLTQNHSQLLNAAPCSFYVVLYHMAVAPWRPVENISVFANFWASLSMTSKSNFEGLMHLGQIHLINHWILKSTDLIS